MTLTLHEEEFENLTLWFTDNGEFRLTNGGKRILSMILRYDVRKMDRFVKERQRLGGTFWATFYMEVTRDMDAYCVNDDKICLVDYTGNYQYVEYEEIKEVNSWLQDNFEEYMQSWVLTGSTP